MSSGLTLTDLVTLGLLEPDEAVTCYYSPNRTMYRFRLATVNGRTCFACRDDNGQYPEDPLEFLSIMATRLGPESAGWRVNGSWASVLVPRLNKTLHAIRRNHEHAVIRAAGIRNIIVYFDPPSTTVVEYEEEADVAAAMRALEGLKIRYDLLKVAGAQTRVVRC